MTPISRRSVLITLATLAVHPRALAAAPIRYRLDNAESQVGFIFVLNGIRQRGTMPVERADIVIDPADLSASSVDVSVAVAGTRTPLIFATQALIGPDMLDAARFPTIRFVSTRVSLSRQGRLSGGASLSGRLTVRGVTRPVKLAANVYRARGTDPDDLSQLIVQLTGAVSRSAFAASGYADLVADTVLLDITAVIRAAK